MVARVETPEGQKEGQNFLLTVIVHKPEGYERKPRKVKDRINKAILDIDTAVIFLMNPFTPFKPKECVKTHVKNLVGGAFYLNEVGATVLFPVNFEVNCPAGHTIPTEEDGVKCNLWSNYGPESKRRPRNTTIKIDDKKIVVKNSIDPV